MPLQNSPLPSASLNTPSPTLSPTKSKMEPLHSYGSETKLRWIERGNPLATLGGALPLLVVLLLQGHPLLPLAVLGISGLAIIFLGTWPLPSRLGLVLGLWGLSLLITVPMARSMRVPPEVVTQTWVSVPGLHLSDVQVILGFAFAAKVCAMLCVVILVGMATDPRQGLRSAIRYLHLPYRVGYAGIASIGFVSRFRQDFQTIRAAQAVRGTRLNGPILGPIYRWFSGITPLIITAIRHAQRLSMSMDARAFGAFRHRTERVDRPWRWWDSAVILAAWTLTAALVIAKYHHGWDQLWLPEGVEVSSISTTAG